MAYETRNVALFGAARGVAFVLMAFFALGAALFVWIGFVPIAYDGATGEMSYQVLGDNLERDHSIATSLDVTMLTARWILHGLYAAICLLAVLFFAQIYLIVRSAQRGDPFISANATRLSRMGWIALAPVLAALTVRLLRLDPPDPTQAVEMAIVSSLGLSFLILARVFRHGAAMREDLEGTV